MAMAKGMDMAHMANPPKRSPEPAAVTMALLIGSQEIGKAARQRLRRVQVLSVSALAALAASQAWAQGAEAASPVSRPDFLVTPRISLSERYTNNAKLDRTGQRSDFVTQVSPGISVFSGGGRVRGTFDYALNAFHYANGTSSNKTQNALHTTGVAELVDGWAFVDFSGNISQQSVSAFGPRSIDSFASDSNSTETATYRLSPYVRGFLGGFADYEARLNLSSTNADSNAASDLRTTEGLLRLNGRPSGPMGWGMDAQSNKTRYSLGRTLESKVLRGRLSYSFTPQLNGFVSVGRDTNNFLTVEKESYSTSGVGLTWTLNQRTKLAGQMERRAFGNSHNLSFEHRTPRTAWRISDVQNVSDTPAQSGTLAVGTLGELLFSQFESLEPDPLRRAELVRGFLLANGYNPNTQVLSNFLASSASQQRRQTISFTLMGVRDTINVSMSRGSNRKLDTLVAGLDDFSSTEVIRQSGFVVSYSHRLTPDASFNVVASRQNTSGAPGLAGTSLRALDVVLSSRLSKQMFASVGARRSFFESATSPYNETSLTGNLNVRF